MVPSARTYRNMHTHLEIHSKFNVQKLLFDVVKKQFLFIRIQLSHVTKFMTLPVDIICKGVLLLKVSIYTMPGSKSLLRRFTIPPFLVTLFGVRFFVCNLIYSS